MPAQSVPAPREADIIWLCRRLASALHAEASILSALDSAAEDSPPTLVPHLRAVRQSIRAGRHIHVAFGQLEWPPFVVGMVYNGDVRNAVEAAFTLIADQLDAERAMPAAKDPDLRAYAISLARLGVMIEAGVPILTALETAAATDPGAQAHDVLLAARGPVGNGQYLAEALASLAPNLPEMTIDMIRDAETDGRLGKALPIIADYLLDAAGEERPRRKKQEV